MVESVDFLSWFQTIQRLSNIKRCDLFFCHWPESVAEHSFFCGVLAYVISNQMVLPFEEVMTITVKAMLHDIFEADVGDISWAVEKEVKGKLSQFFSLPSKQLLNNLELSVVGQEVVEFVDKAELFLNLYREYLAYNENVEAILDKTMELVEGLVTEKLLTSQVVQDILKIVRYVKNDSERGGAI